jgi:transcriptional regulator with XRE-family HTH domain
MDYQTLSAYCVTLRQEAHKTQQSVADDIGISRATLNAFETGRATDIGLRKLLKLLDYYGYEVRVQQKAALPTLEMLLEERRLEMLGNA